MDGEAILRSNMQKSLDEYFKSMLHYLEQMNLEATVSGLLPFLQLTMKPRNLILSLITSLIFIVPHIRH